jgi:beta-galactosidase
MKRNILILTLSVIQLFTINVFSAVPEMRQRILIDKNWKFIQSDIPGGENPGFDDSKWRTLNLPHDRRI